MWGELENAGTFSENLFASRALCGMPKFALLALIVCASVNGSDSGWIPVKCVDASVDSRSAAIAVPGQTRSSTNCTVLGGAVNCNSTSSPDLPRLLAVSSTKILNVVETETHRLKLYCEVGQFVNSCGRLIVGEKFKARIQGTKVLVQGRKDGNLGKLKTLKFKLLDMRPKPEPSEQN